MNVLTILAAGQWLLDDRGMVAAKAYVLLMATLALALGATSLYREIRRGSAEQEFAAWFRPQEGRQLICRDGWWHVVADDALDPPVHRSEVTD